MGLKEFKDYIFWSKILSLEYKRSAMWFLNLSIQTPKLSDACCLLCQYCTWVSNRHKPGLYFHNKYVIIFTPE